VLWTGGAQASTLEDSSAQHIGRLYKVGASAQQFLSDGRKYEDAYRMIETGTDDPAL
jgi:hypothetical protein